MDKIVIEEMCQLNSKLDDMNDTLSKVNKSLDSVVEKLNLMTLEIRLIGVPIEHKYDVRDYLISYEHSLQCSFKKNRETSDSIRAVYERSKNHWDKRCDSILEKNPNIAKYI